MTQSRWRDEPASRNVVIELRLSLLQIPKVTGDPAELREAMTNLILNAVDAMPGGGVLTVMTAERESTVEVTISDTGTGMPEGVKEKIFDPFFTTKPEGTGLGLSISHGIVHDHHGTLDVRSEVGKGSTFTLTFRLDAAPGG
jgi:signal transduction histidine kinase